MPPFASRFALLPVLLACACSSSSSGSPGGGSIPAALSGFCTATLKTSQPIYAEGGPGEWQQQGDQSVPAGTVFLLEASLGSWGGYVFDASGQPSQIEPDGFASLVEGTDFTSDCAPATVPADSSTLFVLLGDVTLYPNADLSGTPCTFPVGTTFTNASFTLTASYDAQISADEITSKCGVGQMYTSKLPFGDLLAK